MIDYDSIKYEGNIAKILSTATELFKQTGLEELAEKWDKILQNYCKARGMR